MAFCPRYSIRTKLFFRISAVILGAFIFFVAALLIEFRLGSGKMQEVSLIEITYQIERYPERFTFAGLSPGNGTETRIPIEGVSVSTLDGALIATPKKWQPDIIQTAPLREEVRGAMLGRDVETDEQLFVVAFLVEGADLGLPYPQVIVHVARPTSNFDPIMESFLFLNINELLWVFIALVAVSIYITKRTIDGAMKSVSDAATVADKIDIDRLDLRLPLSDLPVEVLPLAAKTNDALDRLEEIIRAERSFTSSAAHELRTPLSILRTRMEDLPEGDQRDQLLARVDGLSRIVGQLLQLARVDAWQPDPENQADVPTTVQNVVADFSPRAVQADGDVSFTDQSAQAWVADRVLLEILLTNLLENALKYGGQRVVIDVAIDAEGLTVDDNGPGIAPADRSSAIKPFWRARRDDRGGVGIGLALAARIAEHLGGTLSIEESPAGGCRIRLGRPGV